MNRLQAFLDRGLPRNATNRRRWLKFAILSLTALSTLFGIFLTLQSWLSAIVLLIGSVFIAYAVGQMIHWIDRNGGFEELNRRRHRASTPGERPALNSGKLERLGGQRIDDREVPND